MTRIIEQSFITEDESSDIPDEITDKIEKILRERSYKEWNSYNEQYVVRITVDEINQ